MRGESALGEWATDVRLGGGVVARGARVCKASEVGGNFNYFPDMTYNSFCGSETTINGDGQQIKT